MPIYNNVPKQDPNTIYTPGLMSNGKQNMLQNNFLNPTQYGNASIYTPQFAGQPTKQPPIIQPTFTPVSHTINDYPAPQLQPGMPGWINPDQQLNPNIGGTFNLMDYLRPEGLNGFEAGSAIPTVNPYMMPRNVPMATRPPSMMPGQPMQPSPAIGQPMPVPIKDPRQMPPQAITQQPPIDIRAMLMQEIAKQMMLNGGMVR